MSNVPLVDGYGSVVKPLLADGKANPLAVALRLRNNTTPGELVSEIIRRKYLFKTLTRELLDDLMRDIEEDLLNYGLRSSVATRPKEDAPHGIEVEITLL